jgi:hypothetical protein
MIKFFAEEPSFYDFSFFLVIYPKTQFRKDKTLLPQKKYPHRMEIRRLLPKTTSSGETTFPWKLHTLLEQSELDGFDDIISWLGDHMFKVHCPILFEEKVMKRFFNQSQYKSFQRQREYEVSDGVTIFSMINV